MRALAAAPAVSLIVPFHNPSRRFFADLLASIAAQRTDDPFEVILVDNRSRDGSRQVARDWAQGRPCEIVAARARAGTSYARNVGAAHARGRYLLFVDADDEIAPGYVAAMTRALDAHPFVTSRVDSVTLNPAWARRVHGETWQATEVPVAYDFLPTCGSNVGIRREWFARVRGFPEKFVRGEDAAFCWNLRLRGVPVHFVPDAVYRYRHRSSLRDAFQQAIHWGESDAHLYRHYRRHGMPGRPWRMSAGDWWGVLAGLARTRSFADRAPHIARLGHCLGRARGSLRFRVRYF
jgi:glycosyltransferase involved in cell wall biosynthesis